MTQPIPQRSKASDHGKRRKEAETSVGVIAKKMPVIDRTAEHQGTGFILMLGPNSSAAGFPKGKKKGNHKRCPQSTPQDAVDIGDSGSIMGCGGRAS